MSEAQERGESCQKFMSQANRERAQTKRRRSCYPVMMMLMTLRRSRKIERLERELRELKDVQASCDQQRSRRQRSRSHSSSCESSYRYPKRSEEDHRAPKNSRWSRIEGRTERKSPVRKSEKKDQNPVWNQLRQISHSPFSSRIEQVKLPARIAPLNLITYNGKTDPVAHLSGLIGLSTGSIHSWTELSEAFTTRFITNTRKPKEVDSLMALAMRFGESLKSYSARYWETYNEVIMRLTGAGQMLLFLSSDSVSPLGAINTAFKEPIFKILPQIKNKPYFVWPAKLGGDPASRESKPYCAYHRERGHLTESCSNYKALLEELVRDGHLHQFVDSTQQQQQREHVPKPKVPIGTIDVIHSHARADNLRMETRAAAHLREVFQVSEGVTPAPKRLRKEMTKEIIFTDRDLEGVQLPHSDALVVTMQIGESVMPVGRVTVKVHAWTISSPTEFWVLNSYSPYNAILGRPWLHKMKAVPSTLHQRLRFPTPEGIMEVRGDQVTAKQCLIAAAHQKGAVSYGPEPESRPAKYQSQEREENEGLASQKKSPGVDPPFACHSLNVDPLIRPVVSEKGPATEFLDTSPGLHLSILSKRFMPITQRLTQLVDATSGHQRMSFLDAFQGYHQIAMNPVDEEKTAFITPRGIFCYKVMPFGLKNVGATYQKMITKMFSSQLGKTVEVYIDDMVVKSVYAGNHLRDLRVVFNTLRRHHLKLNASKCAFGVGSGKFLGFMVTQRGIEANPDQISAILELRPPRTVREVQKLTGMAAALIRFISRSAEKCRPFFDLIKKGKNFHWGDQSDQAFERLKEYLAAAPLLSTPVNGESLYVYLAVSEHAVSVAIVRKDYNIQKPVYYTSKTLDGAESRLFLEAQTSPDGYPSEMEWVNHVSLIQHMEGWKLYIDGASNSRGSGLGVVLTAPQGQMMELAIRLSFPASNNVAEYEALLHGLRCAITLQADPLLVYCDSQLVVNQISGNYAAKDEKMKIYLVEAKRLLEKFKHVQVEHIGRDLNGHADALASLASVVAPELRRIISVGTQSLLSVGGDIINEVCSVDQSVSWMSPILAYLKDDTLPADRKEADRIRRVAPRYWVSKEGNLYRRSYTGPYLRCVHPDTVQNLLWEIHEGDAAQYVKKCDKCQRFAPSIHQPAASLNPIASPWPFSQWGLDIVGPLHRAPGNRQWLIVATDYFTKWVEAEPLVHITDADSKRFVWKNIITRFGIPRVLMSDNGSQFVSGPFREFCEQYGIRNHFSTPAYPQGNGQAESSNKTLLDGIKKRLEKAKGRWVEELPNILWTYRTTPRCSTGETPFSLTYEVEAVIPLEIGLPTIRTEYYDPVTNETSLATDLDLAEEKRDSALIHLAAYQNGLRRIYEKRINPRELAVGDLVLRKVMGAKQDSTHGKLGPN
uniref:Uncharacterized protein n=1 Tax=Fagus sylvatica TaxID=28930 RepID=A0A2N9EZE4_FAGSY